MERTFCASYHTLSGSSHGKPPRHTLSERIKAAATAGISAIGACHDDFDVTRLNTLADQARQAGVTVPELEWLSLEDRNLKAETRLFILAHMFDSSRVNVGVCTPEKVSEKYLVNEIRRLADHFIAVGCTVCVEPVVFSSLSDPRRVAELISKAGRPNVGLLWDTWQMLESWPRHQIPAFDPKMISEIQVSGISALWQPSGRGRHMRDKDRQWLFREAQSGRLLPDEGVWSMEGHLRGLRSAGVTAPLSVEIISERLRALSAEDAARLVSKSMLRFSSGES